MTNPRTNSGSPISARRWIQAWQHSLLRRSCWPSVISKGLEPCKDPETGYEYNGFITDTIQRNLGIQLVDGTMPGFAAIIGAAPDDETAAKIVRELQEKNILTFLSGHSEDGNSVTKQLLRQGVALGWDYKDRAARS